MAKTTASKAHLLAFFSPFLLIASIMIGNDSIENDGSIPTDNLTSADNSSIQCIQFGQDCYVDVDMIANSTIENVTVNESQGAPDMMDIDQFLNISEKASEDTGENSSLNLSENEIADLENVSADVAETITDNDTLVPEENTTILIPEEDTALGSNVTNSTGDEMNNTNFLEIDKFLNVSVTENRTESAGSESIGELTNESTIMPIELFDGTEHKINVSALYPGNGSFTIETWVRTNAISDGVAASSGECTPFESYWTVGKAASGPASPMFIRLNNGTGESVLVGSGDLADGKWHQLVFIIDPAGCRVEGYDNGVLEIESDMCFGMISDSSDMLMIGSSNLLQDQPFFGEVGIVRTYPVMMNYTTIISHYEEGSVKLMEAYTE